MIYITFFIQGSFFPLATLHKFIIAVSACKVVKKKILVIDDSSTNIVLLNAVLLQHDYEVITAFSAKEAFRLLESEMPDLILLDLLMPEISGIDFLEKIKKQKNHRDIPVIIVSAVGSQENISLTRELGAVSFISKPVNIDELIGQVSELLKS